MPPKHESVHLNRNMSQEEIKNSQDELVDELDDIEAESEAMMQAVSG